MAETDGTTDAGTIEAGRAGSGAAASNTEPMPTALDALGRELLAIRALAASLVAMTDAALTNQRLASLASASRETIEIRGASRDLSEVIRSATSQPGAGIKVPRTFHDRHAHAADVASDTDDVVIPPMGGGNA